MRREPATENPFDLIKASDYSDAEILDHWVDISEDHGGLVSVLKPRLVMPMLLLGGKGSGKTHLMRYCSAPVQAARHGGSLSKAVANEGYLGIYVRAEGLNTLKFMGKGQSDEAWLAVFSMYFEIWVITDLLSILADAIKSQEVILDEADFCKKIANLFDIDVSEEFTNLDSLLEYLTRVRKSIDFSVNNTAMSRELSGVTITFSAGRLIFGIPKIISALIPELKETLFVYLIDEAENFTPDQQRFLNTLIRYRSGNATIKVGARLYGIRTYNTLGSGEPIKRDAEYERVELDSFIRDHEDEYKNFATKLVMKRLERFRLSASNSELSNFFEELDQSNFFQKPTLELARSADKRGSERPYFKKLRSHLREVMDATNTQLEAIINNIKIPDYPLLEKANLFLLYRQLPCDFEKLLETSHQIGEQAKALLNGDRSKSLQYAQALDHFGSDLLAQLYRDFKRKIPYAGLKTLVHLSQGIPRNFLCILKHIYRRSLFAGERPFAGGLISIESQSEGVLDGANWFWEDAQPDNFGVEVRDGIDALAVLFRTVRYSEKPSECDLCTFSVNFESLTPTSRLVLEAAENWSYLIKIRGGSKNKNTRSVDTKYQLGPMLAPKWGVSEHRRGTIELQNELANALFDPERRSALPNLFRRRVSGMLAPKFGASAMGDGLFS